MSQCNQLKWKDIKQLILWNLKFFCSPIYIHIYIFTFYIPLLWGTTSRPCSTFCWNPCPNAMVFYTLEVQLVFYIMLCATNLKSSLSNSIDQHGMCTAFRLFPASLLITLNFTEWDDNYALLPFFWWSFIIYSWGQNWLLASLLFPVWLFIVVVKVFTTPSDCYVRERKT